MYKKDLETVIKNFPHPITDSPLRSNGEPSKELTEHMVVRLARLEREKKIKDRIINLYRIRDRNRDKDILAIHKKVV